MFSGLSSLNRGSNSTRRPETLVLDLSQAGSQSGTSKATPSGNRTPTPSSSFRSGSSFNAPPQAKEAAPRFNDPSMSDVRVEVVNGKGEVHAVLHCHSNVLREQSDYFFNTLVKRALKESGSSSSEPPPTIFTIQTSRHVPDPEIYVTVFRLFYQEEELLGEDIVCMGSVWKVLQVLVVCAELQFHACTSACVDYLESVPWNDEELEDIVRLVPQLDRLQDAAPVLDRLPVRGWDEDSISDALRMLLIRAVAFLDIVGGNPVTPGLRGGAAISMASPSLEDSGSPSASPLSAPSGIPGGGGHQRSAGAFWGRPLPGTQECRDAACSILRNHQGPLLTLKTKKALLRETFGDLLQCLWAEQKGGASAKPQTPTPGGTVSGQAFPGAPGDGVPIASSSGLTSPTGAGRDTKETSRRDLGKSGGASCLSASPVVLESVYGAQGALTWITGVMIEFSMADEVFKWLASDKEFLSQVLAIWRKPHAPAFVTSAQSAFSTSVSPSVSGDSGEGAEVAAAAAAARGAAAPPAGAATAGIPMDALCSSLSIVRTALLGLASAILAKRVVVNPQLRTSFVRTWVPVLAEICTTSATGKPRMYGLPLTAEEQATILTGYNELVLTLPATDQRTVFQLWFLKQSLTTPVSAAPSGAHHRSLRKDASLESVAASAPPGTPAAARQWQLQRQPFSLERERVNTAGEVLWFSLSPAYKRWLMRLGSPCGLP